MPEDHPARKLTEAGFAGFRVMDPDAENDWLAVLGASYFRTSGWSGQFGLSARGLAIDAGGPGPEEFPRFTRFWLEQAPAGGVVIYALLESPRATGAYRMNTAREAGEGRVPGHRHAALPARRRRAARHRAADLDVLVRQEQPLDRPGLAARDPRQRRAGDAPRQRRAHLAAAEQSAAGDRQRLRGRRTCGGFGLAQRERSFEEYQDDGVFYEKRATAWIEPRGDWGQGSVMLVELPTNDEIHDNIVAFWNPGAPARAGSELDLSYRLSWVEDTPDVPVARFIATRIGAGGVPGQPRPANVVKFVCDLDGKGLEELDRESGVEAVVEASRGTVDLVFAFPIATTDRWRVTFDLDIGPPDPADTPIDLRMYVSHDGKAMSETWLYQVFPSQLHALLAQHA